jgi:hypothetical protein
MRRSLYTDWEYSVSFMDEGGTAVRDLRAYLWAEFFRSPTVDPFLDLTKALGAWEPSWNPAGGSPPQPVRTGFGRPYLDPIDLATGFPIAHMNDAYRKHWSMYRDPDSRESWGGLCP